MHEGGSNSTIHFAATILTLGYEHRLARAWSVFLLYNNKLIGALANHNRRDRRVATA